MSKASIKLAFSDKYDQEHSQQYLEKPSQGVSPKTFQLP